MGEIDGGNLGGGGGDGQIYREERPGGVTAAVAAAAERMRSVPPPLIAAQATAEAVVAPQEVAPEPEDVPAVEAPAPIPVSPGQKPRLVSVVSPPAVPAEPSHAQEEPPVPVQTLSELQAKVAELEARLSGTPSGAPETATETNTETDVVDLTPQQVAQMREAFRAQDETCRTWQQEWLTNQARLDALIVLDPVSGAPVKGILVDNARKIQTLKGVIDPQSVGLNLPELDEIEKAEKQRELKELIRDNRDDLEERKNLLAQNQRLGAAYEERIQAHVEKARTETAQAAAATRESREEQARQTAATSEWNSALKEHTAGMTPEDRNFVHGELLKEAHAHAVRNDGAAPDDFKAFMAGHMVELRARVIARQARGQGQTVQNRQVRTMQPAPRDPAAASPAPTAAQQTGDTRANFRAALQRAEAQTRRVVVR
jgi:hypothetical protein